jgi:hypothetical protein
LGSRFGTVTGVYRRPCSAGANADDLGTELRECSHVGLSPSAPVHGCLTGEFRLSCDTAVTRMNPNACVYVSPAWTSYNGG